MGENECPGFEVRTPRGNFVDGNKPCGLYCREDVSLCGDCDEAETAAQQRMKKAPGYSEELEAVRDQKVLEKKQKDYDASWMPMASRLSNAVGLTGWFSRPERQPGVQHRRLFSPQFVKLCEEILAAQN